MPTYEYECPICDKIVEIRHSIHSNDTCFQCQICGYPMARLISRPQYIFVKGNPPKPDVFEDDQVLWKSRT